jgi:hypothetical protein
MITRENYMRTSHETPQRTQLKSLEFDSIAARIQIENSRFEECLKPGLRAKGYFLFGWTKGKAVGVRRFQ